jgi:hypothetical protein
MGGRPIKPFNPLTGYTGDYENVVRSIDLITIIYKQALKEKMWVFDSTSKRWFTPEEFMEMYQRYDNLDVKWIKALEVRDPYDGLDAADQQLDSICERRFVFEKRIIEYWKSKADKAGGSK